jgi:hypothetical protein
MVVYVLPLPASGIRLPEVVPELRRRKSQAPRITFLQLHIQWAFIKQIRSIPRAS